MEKTFSATDSKICLESGLEYKEHTAKITIKNANGTNGLKYVSTSEEGFISATTDTNRKYVQFIGDSITEASSSYSFTIPKEYGFDYSIIAYSGIALQNGAGWYYGSTGTIWKPTSTDVSLISREDQVGMESAYFSVKRPKEAYYLDENGNLKYNNPAFDVAADNKPDVIVIGIGTNDSYYIRNNVSGVSGTDFTKSYVDFVTNLNSFYPNAEIYILRQFNNVTNRDGVNLSADYDKLREATVNAVSELNTKAFADKVHYIDTTSWDVEISSDKVHPTANGYAYLRDKVYNEIKGSLN